MPSNLRFNVLPSFSGDKGSLVLRLVPRSTIGFVWLIQFKELSFLLNGVAVNIYTKSPTFVQMNCVEEYTDFTYNYTNWIQLVAP